MKLLTYKGIPCVLARAWKATSELELVSTLTGECFRISENELRSQDLVLTDAIQDTLPRECGFIPFPERPREFIRDLQLLRQQRLLEYSKTSRKRRRRDLESDDATDGWGEPVSKAPRATRAKSSGANSGSGSPRNRKSSAASKLDAARQKLLQKGLGDLFD